MPTITVTFTSTGSSIMFLVNPLKLHIPAPPAGSPPATVTWNLVGSTSGAVLDPTSGIVLKSTSPPWTPVVPAAVSSTQWEGQLENTLKKGDPPQVFQYGVTVLFNGVSYTWDPDVQNDPPPPGGGGGGEGGHGQKPPKP